MQMIMHSIARRSLNSSTRFPIRVKQPFLFNRGYAAGPILENDDPTPDKKEGGPDRESIPGDAGGVSI